MPDWSQGYEKRAAKLVQDPVYVLIVGNHCGMLYDEGGSPTAYSIDAAEGFADSFHDNKDLFVFDDTAWEIMTVQTFTAGGGTDSNDLFDDLYRGVYGTEEYDFGTAAVAIEIDAIFTTGPITGVTDEPYISCGSTANIFDAMPSGGSQTLLYQDGRTNIDTVIFPVQDQKRLVTQLLKTNNIIGNRALILGGYRDMAFKYFSVLWTGPVRSLNYRNGVYNFEIDHPLRKLNKNIFEDVESFEATLTSGLTADQTTIAKSKLSDTSYLYESEDQRVKYYGDLEYFAAFYLKINDEYIKIEDSHDVPPGKDMDVERGALNSSASTHSTDDEIDYLFCVEDNPIDIILMFMTTRPGWAVEQTGGYQLISPCDDMLGDLGADIAAYDIDIDSFEDVRDKWFTNDVWRCSFSKQTNLLDYVQKHMLKTLNCNFYINRTGKIALTITKPPLCFDEVKEITEDDIVGPAEIRFDHENIINNVKATYDYDYIDADSDTTYFLIDAESQVKYNRDGPISIQARGVDSNQGGTTLVERYSYRKKRDHKQPNPILPLEVLFNQNNIEPGEVICVTHTNLPDMKNGVMGWERLMAVVGKRVAWDTGTLELELLDTLYLGNRYGVIGPSTLGDYDSATDAERDCYGFISDSSNSNKMSDGTDGYLIA